MNASTLAKNGKAQVERLPHRWYWRAVPLFVGMLVVMIAGRIAIGPLMRQAGRRRLRPTATNDVIQLTFDSSSTRLFPPQFRAFDVRVTVPGQQGPAVRATSVSIDFTWNTLLGEPPSARQIIVESPSWSSTATAGPTPEMLLRVLAAAGLKHVDRVLMTGGRVYPAFGGRAKPWLDEVAAQIVLPSADRSPSDATNTTQTILQARLFGNANLTARFSRPSLPGARPVVTVEFGVDGLSVKDINLDAANSDLPAVEDRRPTIAPLQLTGALTITENESLDVQGTFQLGGDIHRSQGVSGRALKSLDSLVPGVTVSPVAGSNGAQGKTQFLGSYRGPARSIVDVALSYLGRTVITAVPKAAATTLAANPSGR